MQITFYNTEFLILRDNELLEVHNNKGVIEGLKKDNELVVCKNCVVQALNQDGVETDYFINDIICISGIGYMFRYNTKNLISKYVLPLYFDYFVDIWYDDCILNCYINNDKTHMFIDAIPNEDLDFIILEHPDFEEVIKTDTTLVYKIRLLTEYSYDINMLYLGGYSQTTDRYKSKVLSFWAGLDVTFTNEEKSFGLENNKTKPMNLETLAKFNGVFTKAEFLRKRIERNLGLDTPIDSDTELESKFGSNEFRDFN